MISQAYDYLLEAERNIINLQNWACAVLGTDIATALGNSDIKPSRYLPYEIEGEKPPISAKTAFIDVFSQIANEIANNTNLFDELNQLAIEFGEYLKENPAIVQDLANVIETGLKAAFVTVRDLALELLNYLRENPQVIENMVNAMAAFIKVLAKAGELAAELANGMSIWTQGGPEVFGSRNQIRTIYGERGVQDFDRFLQEAMDNSGMPDWFFNATPMGRSAKGKFAREIAQRMMDGRNYDAPKGANEARYKAPDKTTKPKSPTSVANSGSIAMSGKLRT